MSSHLKTDQLTTEQMWTLDDACCLISEAFGHPYLVGSAGISDKEGYRDVDVRLILGNAEFDTLFGDKDGNVALRARWELLSLAIGDFLRSRTRLPIDFQIQRMSEANAWHDGKPRNPLGMGRNFAGGGDATPFRQNKDLLPKVEVEK